MSKIDEYAKRRRESRFIVERIGDLRTSENEHTKEIFNKTIANIALGNEIRLLESEYLTKEESLQLADWIVDVFSKQKKTTTSLGKITVELDLDVELLKEKIAKLSKLLAEL